MAIKVTNFKGIVPKLSARKLPLGYAQEAVNVKLGSGAMECFRALGSSVASVSYPETIHKVGAQWLSWASRRWVERATVSGVADRLLVSAGSSDYPKILADAGATSRRWGVVKPTTALKLALHGAAGATIADTVSYVYTLVTAFGEESDIYTASGATDIPAGRYVSLTNWCVFSGQSKADWQSATGNEIVGIRVYRLSSSASGNSAFQRVSLRHSDTSQLTYDEIPVSGILSDTDAWYDVNATRTGLSTDLGEVLQTEGWDPPPSAMSGACMFANGMYAGFVGKVVYLSMPGYYYAFPASGTMDYTMELPYDVVGLAPFNDTLVVGTAGFPEVISGTDPAFMTRTPLPYQQPCLSGRSMVSLPDGVAYVSPDGLFFVGSSGGDVLTKNVIDRDAWQAYPLTTALCAYHDQKIFIFFQGASYGLLYDRTLDYLVRIEPGFGVRAVFVDPAADVLYLASTSGVYPWEGATSSYLSARWKSGILETPPVNFSAARVEASLPSGHSTQLSYSVDGVVKYSPTITTDNPFRLPSGFRGRDHELEVSFSKSTIDALYLAFDLKDLANV